MSLASTYSSHVNITQGAIMSSTAIYASEKVLPYVYICIHKVTKHYYIGSRTSSQLKYPSNIDLPKYKTSSKIVKPIFEEFDWYIIAEFFEGNHAYEFEQEFIKKSWGDPLLLNRHYENVIISNPGQTIISREKARQRMLSDANPGKNQSAESINKIKITMNDLMKSMTSEERSKKYGTFGEDNPFYGKKHPPEVQKALNEKISKTLRKNKSIWMHNEFGVNARIKEEMINEAYAQGYVKGYAPGTANVNRKGIKLKTWKGRFKLINNGIIAKKIGINEEVPDGWVLGGIKGRKHKPRVDTEPTMVITDGVSTRRIKISEQIPDGWRRGRHYSPTKQ